MNKKFIVDAMLGTLAKWLRLMGIDTIYIKNGDISKIEDLAIKSGRKIITRTNKFEGKRRIESIVLTTQTLKEQIKELNQKSKIKDCIKPLGRCPICNSVLHNIDKQRIKNEVPTYIFNTHEKFLRCPKCKKIYWKGTHYKNIKKRIANFISSMIIICFVLSGCTKKVLYNTTPRGVPLVRVLIAENIERITISSPSSMYVRSRKGGSTIAPSDTKTVVLEDTILFPLTFESKNRAPIFINGTGYPGKIKITFTTSINIINIVDMETYLRGVVPHEIGTRTPDEIEAVKAQAVAARTYAFKHLNLEKKPEYDMVATVYDQVYKGYQYRYPIADSAVNKTYGTIITYKGEPIEAKYSSTCGGRTSDVTDNWGDQPIPYLRSIKDSRRTFSNGDKPFCDISPLFTWNKKFSKTEFYKLLSQNLDERDTIPSSKSIKSISWKRNPISQRITELTIKTDDDTIIFTGLDIRKILREGENILWSNYFYIDAKEDSIFIKGHGAGHGCGMCQWGAIGMSRKGYRYQEILKHYYRGVVIKRKY
jgi:SpoIID/LytB domain protein